jgi:photosystem II stability/assembly factor-like uncharacterized protein
MRQQKALWLPVLLIAGWLLSACAPGAPSPAADNTAMAGGSSSATDQSQTDSSVALAYNPADSRLLLADKDGLFLWQGGSDWQNMALPQKTSMSGVAVNPDQPDIIYASGEGLGVVRSDDGGANWQAVNTGLPSLDVTALALHSSQRATLYAWLKADGIYRTEDGGDHWVRLPDSGPADTDVRGLIHSPLPGSMNTGWLYASTPSGAYLSMDCF